MSPLPDNPKAAWPPPSVPSLDFAVWDEWYSGKFAPAGSTLSNVPLTTTGSIPERLTGGFVHRHPSVQQGSATNPRSGSQPVHCPLAADIAQVSADLLFGDMPDVRVTIDEPRRSADGKEQPGPETTKTQARLEQLLEGVQNVFLEAAETCAALGGVYLRVTWDKSTFDRPFITSVDADKAVPEFRFGRLRAVTFWRELATDGNRVLRHLERHEPGVILHGLYGGSKSELGTSIGLDGHEDTQGLAAEIPLPEGLSKRLACVYVPNRRPNQRNRGSYLGSADIAGAEPFLDSLDEVWSSLMRDIRLAQSRILVPSGTLETNDPSAPRGSGKSFNLDREVFTEIDVPPEGMQPTVAQPAIRTDVHIAAVAALVRDIVSKAGYSPQTYGLDIQGRAESGTALRIREGKTYRTLGRKRRYWEPGMAEIFEALLIVDATEFGSRIQVARPVMVWQEEAMGLGELASTMQALRDAESASIETRVRMVNPDWGDDKVTAEVERIKAETGAAVGTPPEFNLP